ncbi:hypothetical protein FPCIR_13939, partial [Fusarium pseudocircinatum]
TKPLLLSFHIRFPGLARAYLNREFEGECERLVKTLKETPYSYAFVTGGPGSGKTMTAMKLFAAIISGDSDPVTSDKPESTGWLDVDDDDTCSEASFCSAISYLVVGPGSDQLEQEHIIGAHSSDICDDTTLPSDYRVLPTKGGPNLECGLYALIQSMQHQMPDGAATPNSIDDLRSLVDSPEYAHMVAIS